MANIFKDYRKTVGARKNKAAMIAVAETDTMKMGKGKAAPEAGVDYDNEDMAELAENAAQTPATPKDKPKLEEPAAELVAAASLAPKPRPKPIEILMAAAMNIKVEPVSAPPEESISEGDQPATDQIGMVIAATALADASDDEPVAATGKGSIAEMLRDNTEEEEPTLRAWTTASADESNFAVWPALLTPSMEQELRFNGEPQPFAESAVAGILPGGSAEAAGMPQLNVAPSQQEAASGKGDMLVVNRDGKGNFGDLKPLRSASLR
jgi:hypothetical protein